MKSDVENQQVNLALGFRTVSAHWPGVRLELLSWLKRNAPSLAEIYEGAVHLIFDVSFPGRVRFIAHAVREIRNRLPDVISGKTASEQLQYKNRLDEITLMWKKQGLSADGSIPDSIINSDSSMPTSFDVSMPRGLFFEFARLIKDHALTRSRPFDAAVRLFEALAREGEQTGETLRPVIFQWLEVTNWFVKKAHDSGRVDAVTAEEELCFRFELFETTLGALVRTFFVTLDELDEILEDANS